VKDILLNNLDNPHIKLAHDIIINDRDPGYLPFNFFNQLQDEFEKLGASAELLQHMDYVTFTDDFEINPPGW
jgi:hypothetical protein